MIKCLITGCELYEEAAHATVWGDLHQVEGCYVFNAVLNQDGEAAFNYDPEPTPVGSIVKGVNVHGQYFERRGVFVIPLENAWLNKESQEYLK